MLSMDSTTPRVNKGTLLLYEVLLPGIPQLMMKFFLHHCCLCHQSQRFNSSPAELQPYQRGVGDIESEWATSSISVEAAAQKPWP